MLPQNNVPITKLISNNYIIFLEDLLGKGSCGVVYKGCLKDNKNQKFAIKSIFYKSLNNQQIITTTQCLQRELQTQRNINSQFVVKMLDVEFDNDNSYIILEYCEQGNLAQKLKQQIKNRLPGDEALKYFQHIVQGYKALYIKNIVHRDLKPENILFSKDIAKISDFGFSRIVDDMDIKQPLTLLGTPIYTSPEILRGQQYSSNTDIWSLGCILYEMLYGFSPFRDISTHLMLIQKQQKPIQFPQEPQIDVKLLKLIQAMLKVNPTERIGWNDLFVHSLIKYDHNQFKCKQQIMDDQTNSMIIVQMRQQNDIHQVSKQIDQFIQQELEKRDFYIQTIKQVLDFYKLLEQPKVNVLILYVSVIKLLKLTSENLSYIVYCKINNHFNAQQLELYKQSDSFFVNKKNFESHLSLIKLYSDKYFKEMKKALDRLQDQELIHKINNYLEYSDPEVGKSIYLYLMEYYLKDLIKCFQRIDQVKQNRQVLELIISIHQLMEMDFLKLDSNINVFKAKLQQSSIAQLLAQFESIYLSL